METVFGKTNIQFSSHRNSPNPLSHQPPKTTNRDRPAPTVPNPNLASQRPQLQAEHVIHKPLNAEQTLFSLAKNIQIRSPNADDLRSKEVAAFLSTPHVSDTAESRSCVGPKNDFKRFSFGLTDDPLQSQPEGTGKQMSELLKIIDEIRSENEFLKTQVTSLKNTVQSMGREQSRFRELLIDKNAEIELLRSQITRQSSLRNSKTTSERQVCEPLPMQQSDSVSPSPLKRSPQNSPRLFNNITNQPVLTTQLKDLTPSKGDNLRSFLRRITSEDGAKTAPRTVSVTRYVIKDGRREVVPESRTLNFEAPFDEFRVSASERR